MTTDDLSDQIYDVLFTALAEHNLISCAVTETGPDNGIESGHIGDIAERIVAVAEPHIEAQVRRQIASALAQPTLAAIRCIPDGPIQRGCVTHDGATVRERLRQAYLAIQTPDDDAGSGSTQRTQTGTRS